jgi:hypothetical protein
MIGPLLLLAGLAVPPGEIESAPLPFDPAAWRGGEVAEKFRATVEVEEDGRTVRYSGIPLRDVLRMADRIEAQGEPSMPRLRALSDSVIVLTATDGYRVAVSAAEVALDQTGRRHLLALLRDGAPLDEEQGPARLIVAGEEPRVRWIRMISRLDLVKLPAGPEGRGR